VLRILEDVFSQSIRALNLRDVQFNYTGDGYFCAFLGDSSASVLDFINLAIPEVGRRFHDHQQKLRAGLDCGLVQIKQNNLTASMEVTGMPGIIATRLEEAADADTILCSETFHCIFSQAFPEMFSKELVSVKSKDRTLTAYKVLPLELNVLSDILLRLICPPKPQPEKIIAKKRRILLVDDEMWFREMCLLALKQRYPDFVLIEAADGTEALEFYRSGEFDLVLTDVNMQRVDGYLLTASILQINPNQEVILTTGLADKAVMRHGFEIGASDFLPKPFTIDVLYDVVDQAITNIGMRADRDKVVPLSDDPGKMFSLIHESKFLFRSVLSITGNSNDLASHMLRHKAKQLIRDFVARARPGIDILLGLSIIRTQLESLQRLAQSSRRVEVGKLLEFVKNLHRDLCKIHPKIKFKLSCKNFGPRAATGLSEAVILLIISELIDNAIYAVNSAGKIEIAISHLQSSNSLHIVVLDSGPGIPLELKSNIFKEGVSTKGEGRGIGLWLIREAALSLKGDISYDFNKGAEFRVRIPLS
jgi:CheY-like chemotaxis protein